MESKQSEIQEMNELIDSESGLFIETDKKDYKCSFPFKQLVVDAQGRIMPCCCMNGIDLQLGHIDTMSLQEAFRALKNDPVYSLLDFKEEKKAPSNLIFNPYDYWDKDDCEQAVKDLENGEHELSRRHGVDLKIDWKRTLTV